MSRPRMHHIVLTEEDANAVRQILAENQACRTVLQRCRILLAADESGGTRLSRTEIAEKAGTSLNTVTNTLALFAEKGLTPLIHLKRNPASDMARCKADAEMCAEILRLAATPPPKGKSRWTLRMLSTHAKEELGICLSKDTIARILKQGNPH